MSGKFFEKVRRLENSEELKMIRVHKNDGNKSLVFKILRTVPKLHLVGSDKEKSLEINNSFNILSLKNEETRKVELRRSPRILALQTKPKVLPVETTVKKMKRKMIFKNDKNGPKVATLKMSLKNGAKTTRNVRSTSRRYMKMQKYPIDSSSMRLKSILLSPIVKSSSISSMASPKIINANTVFPKFANVDASRIISSLVRQQIISPLRPSRLFCVKDTKSVLPFKHAHRNLDDNAEDRYVCGRFYERVEDCLAKKYHMLDPTTLDIYYSKCIAFKKYFK